MWRNKAMMDKEYDSLRKEIIEWQTRRFTVASGSIVAVVAVLGWAINSPSRWSWTIVSSLLLSVIAIACYLIWLFGLFNTRISTYIEVFHETDPIGIGWERRHRVPRRHFVSSRGAFTLLFGGVAFLSILIPIIVCQPASSIKGKVLFGTALIFFLIAVWALGFRPPPHRKYLDQWRKINCMVFSISSFVIFQSTIPSI
jgi:FtsH-binding integral membrane protein